MPVIKLGGVPFHLLDLGPAAALLLDGAQECLDSFALEVYTGGEVLPVQYSNLLDQVSRVISRPSTRKQGLTRVGISYAPVGFFPAFYFEGLHDAAFVREAFARKPRKLAIFLKEYTVVNMTGGCVLLSTRSAKPASPGMSRNSLFMTSEDGPGALDALLGEGFADFRAASFIKAIAKLLATEAKVQKNKALEAVSKRLASGDGGVLVSSRTGGTTGTVTVTHYWKGDGSDTVDDDIKDALDGKTIPGLGKLLYSGQNLGRDNLLPSFIFKLPKVISYKATNLVRVAVAAPAATPVPPAKVRLKKTAPSELNKETTPEVRLKVTAPNDTDAIGKLSAEELAYYKILAHALSTTPDPENFRDMTFQGNVDRLVLDAFTIGGTGTVGTRLMKQYGADPEKFLAWLKSGAYKNPGLPRDTGEGSALAKLAKILSNLRRKDPQVKIKTFEDSDMGKEYKPTTFWDVSYGEYRLFRVNADLGFGRDTIYFYESSYALRDVGVLFSEEASSLDAALDEAFEAIRAAGRKGLTVPSSTPRKFPDELLKGLGG